MKRRSTDIVVEEAARTVFANAEARGEILDPEAVLAVMRDLEIGPLTAPEKSPVRLCDRCQNPLKGRSAALAETRAKHGKTTSCGALCPALRLEAKGPNVPRRKQYGTVQAFKTADGETYYRARIRGPNGMRVWLTGRFPSRDLAEQYAEEETRKAYEVAR